MATDFSVKGFTVNKGISALSAAFNIPEPTVKAYARQLMDDGVLPKSSGRRIPTMTPDQFVRLIFAVMCAPKISDAKDACEAYFSLPLRYAKERPEDAPEVAEAIRKATAGMFLTKVLADCIAHSLGAEGGVMDWQLFGSVEICTTHKEVVFINAWDGADPDQGTQRITFAHPDDAETREVARYPKRLVSIPCMALKACADQWEMEAEAPTPQDEIERLRSVTATTRRATVPALDDILYQPLAVLDHGFVRVIDYMGDDAVWPGYGRRTTSEIKFPVKALEKANNRRMNRMHQKIPPRKR